MTPEATGRPHPLSDRVIFNPTKVQYAVVLYKIYTAYSGFIGPFT